MHHMRAAVNVVFDDTQSFLFPDITSMSPKELLMSFWIFSISRCLNNEFSHLSYAADNIGTNMCVQYLPIEIVDPIRLQ